MASDILEITKEKQGRITVLHIIGPVDSATVGQFKVTLTPFSKTQGARIVIDVKELTYINSNAIGLLMMFRRQLYINGGRLALCGVSARFDKTLKTMKADSLKIYDNLDDALAALS